MPRNPGLPVVQGLQATCEICAQVRNVGSMFDYRYCKTCRPKRTAYEADGQRLADNRVQGALI